MAKIRTSLLFLVISGFGIIPSVARDKVYVGGINVAHGIEAGRSSRKTFPPVIGGNAGIFFEKNKVGQQFEFIPGFMWMNKGFRDNTEYYSDNGYYELSKERYRMNYIEVLMLAKWNLPLKNDYRFHLSAGPSFCFEFFSRNIRKTITPDYTRKRESTGILTFFELGMWMSAGFDHKKMTYRLVVDQGLLNLLGLGTQDGGGVYRNRAIGISVGFIVPDGKKEKEKKEPE